MRSISAVIFDLYGVMGLNGWQTFKAEHFASRPADWEALRDLGQQVDAGQVSQDKFVAALVEATGETEESVRFQFEHTKPNKPLLEYIADELKPAYKIGLLSNTSHDVFRSIFSLAELDLFDVVVGSFSTGLTKPDVAAFMYICRELDVDAESCAIVDDKKQHLEAAETLGMQGVLYVSPGQTIKDIRRALNGR